MFDNNGMNGGYNSALAWMLFAESGQIGFYNLAHELREDEETEYKPFD